MIVVKSPEEIEAMRECGGILRELLTLVQNEVHAGVSTRAIDRFVEDEMRRRGVVASFKGYHGFPASVCVSINDEVVHGIPGGRVIRNGDIVSLDLGVYHRGFHTDAAVTLGVGTIVGQSASLIEVTRRALVEGVAQARAGNRVGDISRAIQECVEDGGFSVIREYTGHGVGRELHEEPQVPNFEGDGNGPLLRAGMTLAIEPMVTAGHWRTRVGSNGWTVLTADGSVSAHFEHSIVVTEGEPLVFA